MTTALLGAVLVTAAGLPGLTWGLSGEVPLGEALRVRAGWVDAGYATGWSASAEAGWSPRADLRLGLVLGAWQRFNSVFCSYGGGACNGVSVDPAWPLAGLAVRWEPGPWWIAASPWLPVGVPPTPSMREWGPTMSFGPPWLEAGYRVTPQLEVSLRASLLPIALGWRF